MDVEDVLMRVIMVLMAVAVAFLIGFLVWGITYEATNDTGFQMETVKTGDVTWACLKHNGEYIGCNTVEEYK